MTSNLPTSLSIVVIGRNEGERLRRCFASVQQMLQTRLRCEFIYVDSASTDDSVTIAEQLGFRVLPLHTGQPTAARARNAGWRVASGEFILFLDGDTVLHRDFVNQALPFFTNASTAVVWGHRRELYSEHSVYNRALDLDWIYASGWTAFCGGDALMRRAMLEETGGFDETLIAGEEPELCRRMQASGWRIWHPDLSMTGHDLAITRFGQYWHRATRAGHAYAEIAARFRNSDAPFWQNEVERNRKRAAILLVSPIAAIILALALSSLWPLLVVTGCGLLFVARSAWKARWKSSNPVTLLLYGIHSHFQQIPIFLGQLRFTRNRRRGQQSALLEYK